MSHNILEMRDITKTFPGVKALSNVNLAVRSVEIHAICGENGAGKSTLMKVLSGVYPHGSYDGQIVYAGEEVQFRNLRDSEAKGIVIIHQELALSPYLSIAENIFLNNERSSAGLIDWNKTNFEAKKLLDRVGLRDNPTTKINQIGVGKQQLVEIAKALSKDVKLLILDEPTAALNDEDSAHLLELILQLKAEGVTSIIISHKLNEIKRVADTVTVIRDGKTIETIAKDDVTEDRIIKDMVGRDLEHRYPDHEPHIGEELLRVEDWTAHHPQDPSRVIVDHVSINVRAGEIVGIAGLMGAGRTEFAMSLFGHSYGSRISGKVFMRGKEIKTRTVAEAIENGLAYATEDRKTYGLNLIEDIKRNISSPMCETCSGYRCSRSRPTMPLMIRSWVTLSSTMSRVSIVLPSRMIVVEFAMSAISLSLCEIMIDVMPCPCRCSSRFSRCSESESLSAAVGSSRMSSFTFLESALAISTSCCLPTPSWPIGVVGFSSRPTRASSKIGRASCRERV